MEQTQVEKLTERMNQTFANWLTLKESKCTTLIELQVAGDQWIAASIALEKYYRSKVLE